MLRSLMEEHGLTHSELPPIKTLNKATPVDPSVGLKADLLERLERTQRVGSCWQTCLFTLIDLKERNYRRSESNF